LNATPKLSVPLSSGPGLTVWAFADWARVNSMLGGPGAEYIFVKHYGFILEEGI
jgi:hypothetical protein